MVPVVVAATSAVLPCPSDLGRLRTRLGTATT